MKIWRRFTAIAIIMAGGTLLMSSCGKTSVSAKKQNYEFTTLGRASIESVISSNGTLAVVTSVSVLSQMSGRIETLNVDYNDQVKKGQVLATINTDMLKLNQAQAQAAVDKAQANFNLQELAVQNAQTLAKKGLLSDYDKKTSEATLDSAKADLASATASMQQIVTQIEQYAIITSPINGIVLRRDIDVGQSVLGGSSSTSSALFTLTDDLARMQIDAQVDELDSSGITVGNKSGKLLPGMTASVSFIKQKKSNILVAPNAAFRFAPTTLSAAEIKKETFMAGLGKLSAGQRQAESDRYDAAQKVLAAGKAPARTTGGLTSLIAGGRMPGFGGPAGQRRTSTTAQGSKTAAPAAVVKKTLWYIDDSGKLAVTLVEVGMSDGLTTELVGTDELEGRKVILKIKAE